VTGLARVALADPSYKQHNPVFKKRASDNKVSDYEEFRSTFLAQTAGRQGGAGSGPAAGPPAGARRSRIWSAKRPSFKAGGTHV
jgi:hypothetical protein